MTEAPPLPAPVATALASVPAPARQMLEEVRKLIFDVAQATEAVGAVTETVKWGQPSYAADTGTPLRLGLSKTGVPALLAHCQTTVIADAQALYGADLRCEGNRAVLLPVPDAILRQIILSALTYRLKVPSDRSA